MNATLLLTGATGAVGQEILRQALADPRFGRIICLVRPPVDRLGAWLSTVASGEMRRVTVVPGDITRPDLGVPISAFDRVTHVIHCAASVTFDQPLDVARAVNVTGTANVLALCRRLARLERADIVSTCYVAGRRRGLILERDLVHAKGFTNTYERTKYESECLVRATMRDMPLAVHRPSIVVGHSRTGETASWKVLYWPLKVVARRLLPAVPFDAACRLDIVPVDFVASALLALSREDATIGKTLHLAAGPGRDATLGELVDHLSPGDDGPMRVHPRWWRTCVRPVLSRWPSRTIRTTVRVGRVYEPYLQMRQQFDTSQADHYLTAAGVRCPRVLDYIDTVVRAAVAVDFGRKALGVPA